MNIVHSHPLKDALATSTGDDFLLLALDPTSENSTANIIGPTVTGYLHATNDPAKHIQRSRRPLPVNFATPAEADATLREADYITERIANLRTGKKDVILAYRDNERGRATYDAFISALTAQTHATEAYAKHLEAVNQRRETIRRATEQNITRRTLAIVYGMSDAQLNATLREKKKEAAASNRKPASKH